MESTANEFMDLTAPHLPRLFRIGMRLTRQCSDSQDLVQEALTRAWANWSRFERGSSLGAWLSRILVNTFISRCRHQKVVSTTAAKPELVSYLVDPGRLAESKDPEKNWQRSQLSDEVYSALDSLPAHYRQVIELVDLEGLPYKEAALLLDCPLGTVMSRLHRGRRALRRELSDYARGCGIAVQAA